MLLDSDTAFSLPTRPKGLAVTAPRNGSLPPSNHAGGHPQAPERPSYQSASTRLFQDSAVELALRLEGEGSEVARGLAREARELAERFAGWQRERPTDEERVATIQRLFDLNRQAAVYSAA
jgi:hypothetical protein